MKELNIESPRLYLANYFSHLKQQVDLAFVIEHIHNFNDLNRATEIKSNWLDAINLIESFEYECQSRITRIESAYEDKALFNSKTMMFTNDSLIYITDNYIKPLNIPNAIKNDYFYCENLTSESIKLIELKNRFNSLKRINKMRLDLDKMECLNLPLMRIKSIESDSFQNLTSLTRLELIGNELTRLDDSRLFNELINLKELFLSNNKLEHLNEFLFNKLTKLEKLDLGFNSLIHLDATIFNGLTSLVYLSLNSNELKELNNDLFNDLVNLKELNLKNNMLSEIDSKLFESLENLKYLHLACNMIKSFEAIGSSKLVFLDISHNELREINMAWFDGLIGLEFLNLAHNKITKIDLQLVNKLSNLKYLNLANNIKINLMKKIYLCYKLIKRNQQN